MAQDASLLADLGPQPRSAMQVGHSTSASAPRAGLGGDQGVGGSGGASDGTQGRQAERELAIVAYFHRLTTQMFSVLADIVDSTDDDDETMLHVSGAATMATTTGRAPRSDRAGHGASDEGEDSGEEAALLRGRRDDDSDDADVDGEARGCILVGSEALAHMGLDVWSQADADFVRELAARYFLRYAHVEGKGVEVCGLRVC
ncbi:hypothetical protein VTK73DRAFT_851 [Phialemonium thermophilum]|uniref:DUF4484 domain-containing protein n=1 Tax=Phialemonium thermophilum TaxID=223376 RepID=A0ABR3VU84_9PEZI